MGSAFEQVIGYDAIKRELLQICDMIHHKEIYEKLGAKLPKGVLLYGEPGLGKSLMARCFIEESGLSAYTVRKKKGTEAFIQEIADVFEKARDNAPSIILCDDLDKFSNSDYGHRDSEEYVAVQTGIDEVNGCNVFVIATANDIYKLPESLTRPGRFDRKIEICLPSPDDAKEIVKHYLSGKKLSEEVDLEDIAAMVNYSSCAKLEVILNEASVNAAYAGREKIIMEDFITAVFRLEYEAPDDSVKISAEKMKRIALHEAGHIVLGELLYPGCVGFSSLRVNGKDSKRGYTKRCVDVDSDLYQIIIALGGKAAVELYYADMDDNGAGSDIETAVKYIRSSVSEYGACGIGLIDVETNRSPAMSESLNTKSEAVVHSLLERYILKTKEILMKNRDFLEKTAKALLEKQTLVKSDIKAIRDSAEITPAVV